MSVVTTQETFDEQSSRCFGNWKLNIEHNIFMFNVRILFCFFYFFPCICFLKIFQRMKKWTLLLASYLLCSLCYECFKSTRCNIFPNFFSPFCWRCFQHIYIYSTTTFVIHGMIALIHLKVYLFLRMKKSWNFDFLSLRLVSEVHMLMHYHRLVYIQE